LLNLRDPTSLGPSCAHKTMLKKLTYLLLILGVGLNVFLYSRYLYSVANLSSTTDSRLGASGEVTPLVSVFKENVKPVYESPKKITISSQNIEAEIIEVNAAADGSLGTPKDWFKTGWFTDSARLAEPGNLIIDGHYDTNTGAPAAFWRLKNVKVDDIVTLFDEYGRAYHYKVSEVFYLNINDPARLQIFEDKHDSASITLVTCGGIWLPGHGTYSQRLIVKGKLID
jgi:sortase (surface protein transpeptidase)